MKYTPNYGLKKPEQDDFYNVEDFNDNADIIDQALKEVGEVSQALAAHKAEHLRIEIGVAAPENPNSKSFWLEDLGESIDFALGGGLLIGNASTDGSDDVWFDENI
jgi:hypothetical protein